LEQQDPRPRVLRRVIIDMLPYSATDLELLEMQERLGLVPSSLDTLELERKESNARIGLVKPLSEVLVTLSGYSAEALAEYFLLKLDHVITVDDDDEDDEGSIPVDYIRKTLVAQNKQVIATSVHTIVSHLVQTGVLEYGEGFRQHELLG
jgi:hypothetical protein